MLDPKIRSRMEKVWRLATESPFIHEQVAAAERLNEMAKKYGVTDVWTMFETSNQKQAGPSAEDPRDRRRRRSNGKQASPRTESVVTMRTVMEHFHWRDGVWNAPNGEAVHYEYVYYEDPVTDFILDVYIRNQPLFIEHYVELQIARWFKNTSVSVVFSNGMTPLFSFQGFRIEPLERHWQFFKCPHRTFEQMPLTEFHYMVASAFGLVPLSE